MGKVEGGVLGVGGDCEEKMATRDFAVGEAATFPAKDEGDVLSGWRQFCGKVGQGNGSGKAVSGSGGGADDKMGLGDGVFKGAEAEGVAQDGLRMSGGSPGGGVLEVTRLDEAEIENAKVVHSAGNGADVFREGRLHQNNAKIGGEVWHWVGGCFALFGQRMVGAGRFELPTSWSRSTRAARLRYAPNECLRRRQDCRKGTAIAMNIFAPLVVCGDGGWKRA